MSQTLKKAPVTASAAMAAACSKLHTDLVGQLTMSELFTENLGSLAPAAAGKLPSLVATLHDEHVTVDRRAVTDSTVPADAIRERTIERTETAEEAVVAKDARVVEEVVVRKTMDDRTETVSDTVRRTEVEVDDIAGTHGRTGVSGTAGAASLGDKVVGLAKEGYGKVSGDADLARRGETQQGKTGH